MIQMKTTLYTQKSSNRLKTEQAKELHFSFCQLDDPSFNELLKTVTPTFNTRRANMPEAVISVSA